MDEVIKWTLDGSFPVDGNLVLVEVALLDSNGSLAGTEVVSGFLDGETWRDSAAIPMQHVVSWAPMPHGTRGKAKGI